MAKPGTGDLAASAQLGELPTALRTSLGIQLAPALGPVVPG